MVRKWSTGPISLSYITPLLARTRWTGPRGGIWRIADTGKRVVHPLPTFAQKTHFRTTNIQHFFLSVFGHFWKNVRKIFDLNGKKRKKKKKKGPKLEEAKSSGKFKPKTFSYQIAPKKSTKITKAKR
jgi:hypothetical protein